MKIAMLLLLALAANVLAISVKTLDEQVDSKNITILRLRVNNETENAFHDVSVKYFVKSRPVLDSFDLHGVEISLDSLDGSVYLVIFDRKNVKNISSMKKCFIYILNC